MSYQAVGEGMAQVPRRAPAAPVRSPAPVMLITGTRPDIIKTASVVHALAQARCASSVVHSGQHADGISELYRFFELAPAASIDLGPRGPQLADLTARLLAGLDPIVAQLRPAILVVQGDTTTALAGALLGFYHRIPVAHIEAGLRSGDPGEPFPEEVNRQLITRLAAWHFAPTPLAVACLRKEGVPLKAITMTGNTVVDAALFGYRRLAAGTAAAAPAVRRILVTAHRRENWGAGIAAIGAGLCQVIERFPDVEVLWLRHPNPEVAGAVDAIARQAPAHVRGRLHIAAPLSYPDMLQALRDAWLVVTDSGGLQEEAVTARVPVLIARRQTERPEVVHCGAGHLIGADARRLVTEISRLYHAPDKWEAMRPAQSPFGDGTAGQRIATVLARFLQTRPARGRRAAS